MPCSSATWLISNLRCSGLKNSTRKSSKKSTEWLRNGRRRLHGTATSTTTMMGYGFLLRLGADKVRRQKTDPSGSHLSTRMPIPRKMMNFTLTLDICVKLEEGGSALPFIRKYLTKM